MLKSFLCMSLLICVDTSSHSTESYSQLVHLDSLTHLSPSFIELSWTDKQWNETIANTAMLYIVGDTVVLQDSLVSMYPDIKVGYFASRELGIKIPRVTDVRGNESYNLYSFSDDYRSLTKVSGFEEIKNPVKIGNGLIHSMVVSGRISHQFYYYDSLTHSISNLDLIIYEDNDETSQLRLKEVVDSLLTLYK